MSVPGRHHKVGPYEVGRRPDSTHDEVVAAADSALAALPVARRVLDVGCGRAALLHEIVLRVPYGEDFVGVDPDPDVLAAAGRHLDGRIRLVQGYGDALPFADEAFDLTVTLRSLALWDDRLAGLTELRRVTRPGGRVVVVDHLPGRELRVAARTVGLRVVVVERATRRLGLLPDLRAAVLEP